MAFDIEAQKRKIKMMLAKAEDRSATEAERIAFTEQAERMMLRLGIELAELESVGEKQADPIVQIVMTWHGNYSIVMIPFVADVAAGFGNLTVLQSSDSAMRRYTYIIGHQSDVEAFQLLVTNLHLQVMADLKAWQRVVAPSRRYHTDMEKYTENRSFIAGFGSRVGRRLRELRQQEETSASTGAELVLRNKRAAVDTWVQDNFSVGRSRGGMKTDDWAARTAGARAGDRASLGGKQVGGGGRAIGR